MTDQQPQTSVNPEGRRRVLGLLGIASVAACLAPVLSAPTAEAAVTRDGLTPTQAACRLSLLPVPDGTVRSAVNAGDPTGRYLLGDAAVSIGGNTSSQQVLWVDGQLTPFQTPYQYSTPVAVNQHGAITGYALRTGGWSFGWRYQHGHLAELPGLQPGDTTLAAAINARGDVAGYSVSDPTGSAVAHAVVWPANRPGSVRELTVPGQAGLSAAIGIDDNGTILGYVGGQPGATFYVWSPDGTPRQLPAPAGTTDATGNAIRNGWVAGSAFDGQHSVPVRWNLRSGSVEQLSTEFLVGVAVNRYGSVSLEQSIAHRDGRIVPLPGLTEFGPLGASVLTDRGTAAGFANDGIVHAVTWTGC
jgi:hypothetical protein